MMIHSAFIPHLKGAIFMTIAEQIKILCVRSNITVAELARRLDSSSQVFSGKLKRQKFSVEDLRRIAAAVGCSYEQYFVLPNGEKI